MNRQEAKEPMYELAQKNGLTVYDPETDASRPKGVTLDLEDTISGDAYTSPLATGKLSFQVHVPTGKLDPDENHEVSRYYSAMAGMQEEELLKNPPSYDVTPEKKAEFHKRLEALPDLQNGTEAEKAFYQAYTAYHEKYKDAGEDFGFYGASQHQNVAKAMLQAGISEEETASVLASKDPYVVSTDAIPTEEIARRMTAFAASSLVAEQYGKDHKDDTQVVYRSTDLIDDTLEWMQSEKSDRSYEVMGFIEWYADGMGQYDEIPVYAELLQDLYERLDAEKLLTSPIPEEALDAAQDTSDIYALSSRIDTLNPQVQHVVKNWMEEKANYSSFGNEADWYAFQRYSYDRGREDLENLLHEQSDRFPVSLVREEGQKETYAFVNWGDEQASLKDVKALDDIIDELQNLTYQDADICIEYKPNDVPSLRMDDGTAIIPESRFKEAMEKHPDLDKAFQNAIRECDNENDGLRDFYIKNTGRVPASAVQNRISDYLNDDDSLHDDALRANIEDLALNCPLENMVKRFQHAYEENGFRGLSEAWEDSIETPRNVVKTGESFRALEGLYKDVEYINRENAFAKKGGCVYQENKLPPWAHGSSKEFFRAADRYSPKTVGRYKEFEFSLQNELTLEQNLEIVRRFIDTMIPNHYYAFAVHDKIGALSEETHNLHVHLMFSPRVIDEAEEKQPRKKTQYFKYPMRANVKNPTEEMQRTHGAPIDRRLSDRKSGFISECRAVFAQITNETLEKYGHRARVDHRSLKEQEKEARMNGDTVQELPWDERQTAFRKVTEAGRCWNTVMMDLLSINPKDREAAKGVLSAYAKEKGFTNGKG